MPRLLAAVVAALLLLPATAGASTTLTLSGSAVTSLKSQGVKLSAVKPATLKGSKLALKAKSVSLTRVDYDGALRLKKGSRTVTIKGWQAALSNQPTFSTQVGSKRSTLLSTSGDVSKGAKLTLTTKGAATIKKALKLKRLKRGAFGRVTLSEQLPDGGTGTPTNPAAGGPPPATAPITNEPPLLARPATAVDIKASTITWRVRDSFVQYLNAGGKPTDGTQPIAPGTADAPMRGCTSSGAANDAELLYQFHFPFKSGWYDPASGTAALYYSGGVHFGYADHTIDLNGGDPEIELNGASSRAIFRFNGSGGTAVANKREVLMNLATAAGPVAKACTVDPGPAGLPASAANPDGTTTYTYERIAGVIPDGSAQTVFAGFYLPGDKFGWMTVSFTV
ncbi:HtaA domain-containing protein [Solirubrobacter phytolaccae]|uniref:HtaA domain-containing protein n=1 Tax=Solirubrobacter phytolaccae TaxID=1404360 RepID=A0A9X3S9J5_9ACTN|nr:HtaA domain-containing protein [Solirubrobacter phytolaccae]MDA0181536.1 HtaA domain-containing protein [Solirubrobacter phytolaccae]